MSAVNTPDTSYPGTETIIHYGQQRGGKCGEITEHDFPLNIKTTTSYYGPLRSSFGGGLQLYQRGVLKWNIHMPWPAYHCICLSKLS